MLFSVIKALLTLLVGFSALSNEVNLAISSDYAPIHFGQNNPRESISTDVLREIFKNQDKYQLKFNGFPWERAQVLVKEGAQDAFISIPTPARMQYTLVSQSPVLIQNFKIYYNINSNNILQIKKIKTLNDLDDMKICEYFSSGWAKQNLEKYLKNIIYSRTIDTKLKMLNSGRCDLILEGDIVVNYYIKNLELKNIATLNIEIEKTKFHLMVSQKSKNADFLDYFNKNNLMINNPLKYEEIINKWTK